MVFTSQVTGTPKEKKKGKKKPKDRQKEREGQKILIINFKNTHKKIKKNGAKELELLGIEPTTT
jgi:hypothetical protein